MTQYFEDFENGTVGVQPTGWTKHSTGGHWTMKVQTVSSQKSCVWDNGGFNDGISTLLYDATGTASNAVGGCDIMGKMQFAANIVGDATLWFATIYANTGTLTGFTGYVLTFYANTTTLAIIYWENGSANGVVGSGAAGLTLTAATDYWYRFGVNGSGVFYGKIWTGTAANEPGGAGSGATSAQATGTNTTVTSGLLGQAAGIYNALPTHHQMGFGTAGSLAPSTTVSSGPPPLLLTSQFNQG